MLRIRQWVAGVGKNRIQGHTTTDCVIAVPDIAAVRVYRDHSLRLMEPDLPHQLLAKFAAILQALVWEAQEHHLSNTQNLSRLALLLGAASGEVFRFDVSIARAFISIRTDYQDDLPALLRPACNGPTCSAFSVIRMRRYH
jgi:hypothetical protein